MRDSTQRKLKNEELSRNLSEEKNYVYNIFDVNILLI